MWKLGLLNGYQTHGQCPPRVPTHGTSCTVGAAYILLPVLCGSVIASMLLPATGGISADGVEAAAAQTSYSKKVTPAAPCGRYGATAVVYNQQLWLFGGTDGGFSKKHTSKSKSGKKPNSRPRMPSYTS